MSNPAKPEAPTRLKRASFAFPVGQFEVDRSAPAPEQEDPPSAEPQPEPASVVSEPVVEVEPDPVAEAEPEPVAEVERDPVAEAEPEPVAEVERDPVAEAEPEPVAEVELEAEAVLEAEPETVAEAEPEPAVEVQPEPEPVAALEPVVIETGVAATDPDQGDSESHDSQNHDFQETGFAGLGLRRELLKTITALGYKEPTPIQRETIPVLLHGHDVVGQAATGTGKTAAFALPILNALGEAEGRSSSKGHHKNDRYKNDRYKNDKGAKAVPQGLVIVPTRELAVQVSDAMEQYGRDMGIKVVPVFGGQPIHRQLKSLHDGVHVVVGTPGRTIDLIKRRALRLSAITTVVLDEADEMLDMGFMEDIESILDQTPEDRQTVLFSATMPPRITSIANRYQTDPIRIKIASGKNEAGNPNIRQTVYMVHRAHKTSALGRILDIEAPGSAIVFCRTRTDVDELTVKLNARGYRAEALHGGMDQQQRDRVMARLRDGTAELLVATDVAARGLDVDTLTHVVNFDVPAQAESYVHRIGRVGRAGREGVAITLAEPRQRRLLGNIERLIKKQIDVARVPSVADLRKRQIQATVEALAEALDSDDLEDYAEVLYSLSDRAHERHVALAAIKLVHQASATTDDLTEIPDASEKRGKGKWDKGDRGANGGKGKWDKKGRGRERERGGGERYSGETGMIHIDLGRRAGLRPGDFVGAIANETNLSGSDIGPIRINDGYSVVGVPEDAVQQVIKAITATTVRGKKVKARRYEN